MAKASSNHICLAVIKIDSALKKDIICKIFWKNANTFKKKKVIRHIIDHLEIYFDDSDKE